MKYLVLGSNSFAGSTYVSELLKQGKEVIGISRSDEVNPVLSPYINLANKKQFSFYQYDINQNIEDIKNLIDKYKPQYIVDFASQSMVAESWQYPHHWYTTNIVAKVRLHDHLRQCDFLERYVRISTPEIFGHSDNMITEEHPFNPTTPYAVSQAATDMSLMAYYKQYGFPVIFTRYANFYGPYQQFYRIIPKAIIYAHLNKKLPLHGGGKSERAFIYGTDVANAIEMAIKNGKLGEAYHFSTNECLSIADLIKKITDAMGRDFHSLVEVTEDRPGKDFRYFMDSSKAETELQWKPLTMLDQGINNTIQWVNDNIDSIKKMNLNYLHKA